MYLENRAFELLELGISTLREPVLSSAAIRAWKDKGAVVTRDTLDTCVVSYATSTDSSWTYKIDKARWLVSGLVVHQNSPDSNVFDGTFFYRDSGGIPVLEKIALMKDTTMRHGGYVFSNIKINELLPDSMFTIGVIHARSVVEKGKFGIIVTPFMVTIEFPEQTLIRHALVYDAFGRLVVRMDAVPNMNRFVWRYGAAAAGFYVVYAESKDRAFQERFFLAR